MTDEQARVERREQGRDDTAAELLIAVRQLTSVVTGVDQLLRDEYPKRTEIERRFVSKLQQKSYVVRLVVVALLTVVACYTLSTGVYAVCFVGQEDPAACKAVPGYDERIQRKEQLDKRDADLDKRLRKLEEKKANR